MIEHQAQQGVDFMTVHCGLLREHVPLAQKRVTGIVSRGGGLLAQWMMRHNRQNPLYERFDDLCDIARRYDVTLSLGDGLRPGSLIDASDAAQFAELETLGELTERAWAKDVQVIIEGPGPRAARPDRDEREAAAGGVPRARPSTSSGRSSPTLRPATITSRRQSARRWPLMPAPAIFATSRRASTWGCRRLEDVKTGVVTYKIAAHAADVARGRKGARDHDDAMSRARYAFDWEPQFALSLDPETARRMHDESLPEGYPKSGNFCSMCGPKFCPMRISHQMNEAPRRKGEAR